MQIAITRDDKVVELKENGTWSYPATSISCLEKCRTIEQTAELIALVDGLFERLEVHILDTGEEFTCTHRGDRIDFEEVLDKNSVDFGVQLYSFQIDRVVEYAAAGYKDEMARFYLARELFPTTSLGKRNTLNHPLTYNPIFRWMINGKNLIHVYLKSPDPSDSADAPYTLFFLNGHWHVTKGTYGEAKRVFRISVQEAWELQRRMYFGMKNNSWKQWYKIAKWYVGWRKKVEV